MKKTIYICCIIILIMAGCKGENEIGFSDSILISSISTDLNNDQIIDVIRLSYNDKLRLKINETERIIEASIDREILNNYPETYNMYYIKGTKCIGISYKNFLAKDRNIYLEFFNYMNNSINKIWTSSIINIEINGIFINEQKVSLRFPFTDKFINLILTEDEIEHSKFIADELKNNGFAVEKVIEETKQNIVCNPRELVLEDYNNDGKKELIILSNIYTFGAKTPVSIREKVLFIFDISSDVIKCIDIIFERDVDNQEFPFAYFI